LKVDDVIDGGLGADVLEAVKLVGAVENDGANADALPLAVGQGFYSSLLDDDHLFVGMPVGLVRHLPGIQRGHMDFEIFERGGGR